ncbi:MAG: hypothetical protein VX075_08100 [Pseudomonadota bacterium]|nr:hypothetical protein [Pseudomonadota bacterium]
MSASVLYALQFIPKFSENFDADTCTLIIASLAIRVIQTREGGFRLPRFLIRKAG